MTDTLTITEVALAISRFTTCTSVAFPPVNHEQLFAPFGKAIMLVEQIKSSIRHLCPSERIEQLAHFQGFKPGVASVFARGWCGLIGLTMNSKISFYRGTGAW